jgi:hypothetical protein
MPRDRFGKTDWSNWKQSRQCAVLRASRSSAIAGSADDYQCVALATAPTVWAAAPLAGEIHHMRVLCFFIR